MLVAAEACPFQPRCRYEVEQSRKERAAAGRGRARALRRAASTRCRGRVAEDDGRRWSRERLRRTGNAHFPPWVGSSASTRHPRTSVARKRARVRDRSATLDRAGDVAQPESVRRRCRLRKRRRSRRRPAAATGERRRARRDRAPQGLLPDQERAHPRPPRRRRPRGRRRLPRRSSAARRSASSASRAAASPRSAARSSGSTSRPRARSASTARTSRSSARASCGRCAAGCRWSSRTRTPRSTRGTRVGRIVGEPLRVHGLAPRARPAAARARAARDRRPARRRRRRATRTSSPAASASASASPARSRVEPELHRRRRARLGARRLDSGADHQPARGPAGASSTSPTCSSRTTSRSCATSPTGSR